MKRTSTGHLAEPVLWEGVSQNSGRGQGVVDEEMEGGGGLPLLPQPPPPPPQPNPTHRPLSPVPNCNVRINAKVHALTAPALRATTVPGQGGGTHKRSLTFRFLQLTNPSARWSVGREGLVNTGPIHSIFTKAGRWVRINSLKVGAAIYRI